MGTTASRPKLNNSIQNKNSIDNSKNKDKNIKAIIKDDKIDNTHSKDYCMEEYDLYEDPGELDCPKTNCPDKICPEQNHVLK